MNSSDLTFQCNDVIVRLLSLRWCGRQRRGSTSGYPNTWMVNINNKLKYVVPQVSNFDPVLTSLCLALYIRIYIHMMVDQNSFIRERPLFANKNVTFAKLSRTPCLSFAGPMLGNNTSYEDSFTTCQSTQENHRSLLDSLFNMQLASRNPFSGQIVA